MTNIFNSILSLSKAKQLDMRTAAWMLGIKRIAEAQKIRGLYP
jgi:glutamate dehydrogenase (NAD(P)+)